MVGEPSLNMPKHVIAIDWGTSHLRAFLCQVEGNGQFKLVEQANSFGVSKVVESFEKTLSACITPWLKALGDMPIYAAGQVSSSIGWQETPYLACPIMPADVANACVKLVTDSYDILFVPGLSCQLSNDNYDVLRGEEIQILGWLNSDVSRSKGSYLLCLPGTHTKWVLVSDGQVKLFKTAMTGELFDLLCHKSVLIQPSEKEFNQKAFDQGLNYTLESELGNFTHGLFSVRSKQLFGEFPPSQAAAYLSGMLIGTDVRAALNAKEWQAELSDKVHIIGASHLSECFARALGFQNVDTQIYDVKQLTIAGFSALHQSITN